MHANPNPFVSLSNTLQSLQTEHDIHLDTDPNPYTDKPSLSLCLPNCTLAINEDVSCGVSDWPERIAGTEGAPPTTSSLQFADGGKYTFVCHGHVAKTNLSLAQAISEFIDKWIERTQDLTERLNGWNKGPLPERLSALVDEVEDMALLVWKRVGQYLSMIFVKSEIAENLVGEGIRLYDRFYAFCAYQVRVLSDTEVDFDQWEEEGGTIYPDLAHAISRESRELAKKAKWYTMPDGTCVRQLRDGYKAVSSVGAQFFTIMRPDGAAVATLSMCDDIDKAADRHILRPLSIAFEESL